MFDAIQDPDPFEPAQFGITNTLDAFVQDHREALLNAAGLLAGRRGVRLTQSVVDGLADAAAPSRRVMRDLRALLDILMLEHVHDASREEAALFAAIDPADPCVEEICLLADGLRQAIDAADALHEDASVPYVSGRAAA